MRRMNVCVVGVGAVGVEMLRLLRIRSFPVKELRVFARRKRNIIVDRERYEVESIYPDGFEGMDLALFAGTEGEKGASLQYAPEAVKRGSLVIDNGADFRMDKEVPLVIPEVNPHSLRNHRGIIANPNCSTIQMVIAIFPIYKRFGIRRIIVSTYQSSSGAGRSAQEQLWEEINSIVSRIGEQGSSFQDEEFFEKIKIDLKSRSLPQQLAFNCFPHIGGFQDFDYTSEEWKMVRETHKILEDPSIHISATCVRVPVFRGHAEALYVETEKEFDLEEVKVLLSEFPGIDFKDTPSKNIYPQPLECAFKEKVFVGRVRKDPLNPKGLWLWVVSDNLWKGASLNAIQIAETCLKEGILP